MMEFKRLKVPPRVKDEVAVLEEYGEDKALNEFDILHLYRGPICHPKGYYDARWMKVVGYNRKTRKYRNLGVHDGVSFTSHEVWLNFVRFFVDGSAMVKFVKPIKIEWSELSQDLEFVPIDQ